MFVEVEIMNIPYNDETAKIYQVYLAIAKEIHSQSRALSLNNSGKPASNSSRNRILNSDGISTRL